MRQLPRPAWTTLSIAMAGLQLLSMTAGADDVVLHSVAVHGLFEAPCGPGTYEATFTAVRADAGVPAGEEYGAGQWSWFLALESNDQGDCPGFNLGMLAVGGDTWSPREGGCLEYPSPLGPGWGTVCFAGMRVGAGATLMSICDENWIPPVGAAVACVGGPVVYGSGEIL